MQVGRGIVGGVVGGAVMTLFMALGRASGVPIALETVLGTLSGGAPTTAAWILGFAIHLVISAGIAIGYAAVFELVAHRASWRLGLIVSIGHTAIEWAVVTLVSEVRPIAPEILRLFTPGESAFIGFAVVHAIYGAIVGGVYGPTPASLADALFAREDD